MAAELRSRRGLARWLPPSARPGSAPQPGAAASPSAQSASESLWGRIPQVRA